MDGTSPCSFPGDTHVRVYGPAPPGLAATRRAPGEGSGLRRPLRPCGNAEGSGMVGEARPAAPPAPAACGAGKRGPSSPGAAGAACQGSRGKRSRLTPRRTPHCPAGAGEARLPGQPPQPGGEPAAGQPFPTITRPRGRAAPAPPPPRTRVGQRRTSLRGTPAQPAAPHPPLPR